MDKYEFNLKMEQMKKLIHEEDYGTALKIVESIDWNRVRNINLLTMAATVYEKNDMLSEARDVLHLALDRAPVGKRILYKLAEIAVRMGSLDEAEDYYYEFRQADSTDIGNFLLQYMILKARHAPYEVQLQPLELYCQADPDEKWLYELATSYDYAGRREECIKTCDRIALLYGDSSYGIKALRLKMRYTDLTDEQKNMLYPRSAGIYAEPASDPAAYRAYDGDGSEPVRENYADDMPESRAQNRQVEKRDLYKEYGLMEEPADVPALNEEAVEEYESHSVDRDAAIRNSDALAAARYADEDAYFDAYVRKLEQKELEKQRELEERATSPRPVTTAQVRAERQAVPQPEPVKAGAADQGSGAQTVIVEDAAKNTAPSASENTQEESGEADDEGTQMTFDFGGGTPKVVEEAVTAAGDEETADTKPEEVSIKAPDITGAAEAAAGTADVLARTAGIMAGASAGSGIPKASGSAIAAVEAALNQGAERKPERQPEVPAAQPAKPADRENAPAAAKISGLRDDDRRPVPVKAPEYREPERPRAPKAPVKKFHMIVEARSVKEGLNIAVDELKRIHELNGISNAATKTTAKKLNEIGLSDSVIDKIRGKDLVIEGAGGLKKEIIEELYDFIRFDQSGTIIVMIDTPDGLDHIEDIRPELFDTCDYISDIDDEEYVEEAGKKAAEGYKYSEDNIADEAYDEDEDDDEDYEDDEPYEDEADDPEESEPYDEYDDEEEDEADEEYEPVNKGKKRSSGKVREKFNNVRNVELKDDGEEMEIDDFAQYCSQYAASIDCSITGKSMLALYERIELMEEEGIPLTKKTAEDLIEEAADKAEKPPIGKRISGMFHSKYDKNGCLILKEDDFI